MYDIDILMRNREYANYLQATLKQGGFSSKIVHIDKISFKAEKLILLDAHYEGYLVECRGLDIVPQINFVYNNFAHILMATWFDRDQLQKLGIVKKNKLKRLEIYDCELKTFPLSIDNIIASLKKINI